ncbi:META and DUF4377 domain-containing protein [Stenotrophomonas mori]|uniref:META and DUF4377 domain-containing protein n=1 Tax=Stenotrophomonas mori TaxID=2871096 RepID=A0ABT0SKA5_9GAMM|nr:META and DUF4377 domain-containing protein [Stenotrophomonas mori]MCL7715772.1 META and DUF4377 domain-containing protein [Stenotrophomonas mori]
MKRTLLLALPIALMAACTNTPSASSNGAAPAAEAEAAPAATIDGKQLGANHWLLEAATDSAGKRIDALFVRADKPITLDFGDGRLSVDNACNRMSGGYSLSGGEMTISRMASTMMACTDPAVMALDKAVGSRLEGTLKVQQLDGATLRLATASGDVLTFAGEPTAETRYGGPGETVFLEVDAQTKPCSHPLIRDMQCLQVREVHYDDKGLEQGERGAYGNFYDTIQGYDHEPGVRNVLRVKRYTVKNPPADASSRAYVLDMVVGSESVGQ